MHLFSAVDMTAAAVGSSTSIFHENTSQSTPSLTTSRSSLHVCHTHTHALALEDPIVFAITSTLRPQVIRNLIMHYVFPSAPLLFRCRRRFYPPSSFHHFKVHMFSAPQLRSMQGRCHAILRCAVSTTLAVPILWGAMQPLRHQRQQLAASQTANAASKTTVAATTTAGAAYQMTKGDSE